MQPSGPEQQPPQVEITEAQQEGVVKEQFAEIIQQSTKQINTAGENVNRLYSVDENGKKRQVSYQAVLEAHGYGEEDGYGKNAKNAMQGKPPIGKTEAQNDEAKSKVINLDGKRADKLASDLDSDEDEELPHPYKQVGAKVARGSDPTGARVPIDTEHRWENKLDALAADIKAGHLTGSEVMDLERDLENDLRNMVTTGDLDQSHLAPSLHALRNELKSALSPEKLSECIESLEKEFRAAAVGLARTATGSEEYTQAKQKMDDEFNTLAEFMGFSNNLSKRQLLASRVNIIIDTVKNDEAGRVKPVQNKLLDRRHYKHIDTAERLYIPSLINARERYKNAIGDQRDKEITSYKQLLQEFTLMIDAPDDPEVLSLIHERMNGFRQNSGPSLSALPRLSLLAERTKAGFKSLKTQSNAFVKQGGESAISIWANNRANTQERIANYQSKKQSGNTVSRLKLALINGKDRLANNNLGNRLKPGRGGVVAAVGVAALLGIGALVGSGDSSEKASFAPAEVTTAAPEKVTSIPEITTTVAETPAPIVTGEGEVVGDEGADEGGEDEADEATPQPPVTPPTPAPAETRPATDLEQDVNNSGLSSTTTGDTVTKSYQVNINGQKDSAGNRWLWHHAEQLIGDSVNTGKIADNDKKGQEVVAEAVQEIMAQNEGRTSGPINISKTTIQNAAEKLLDSRS